MPILSSMAHLQEATILPCSLHCISTHPQLSGEIKKYCRRMRINTQLQRVPWRTTPLWNAILNCASLTLACKSFMQPSACVERFSCNENSHEKISTCKRKIKIGQLLLGRQQELLTTFSAQGAFWLFAIIQRFGKSKFPTYQRQVPHCYIWSEGTRPGWFNFLCVPGKMLSSTRAYISPIRKHILLVYSLVK